MSRASTASTSLTPTPVSFDDLATLGEYILAQLGLDRRSDNLLVHWVAHRLAERMQTAERAENPTERDTARDAAALLIAQLWQARGGWPQGWPPDAVHMFVDGVRTATGQSHGEESVRLPPWLSTLGELDALHQEERATWLDAALLELGADELEQALAAAPNETPEPDDLSDIRWQVRHHAEAKDSIAARAKEGEDPARRTDRAQILERSLNDIAERRSSLIERTLADARRGLKRKPLRQAVRGTAPRRRRSRRRSGGSDT